MLTEPNARDLIGATAYSSDGQKIGKVGQLFLDDQSGQPEFVTVNTGLLGTKENFVPVSGATVEEDRLTVPFSKDTITDAPSVAVEGGHLDSSEEQALYEYYGMRVGTSEMGVGTSEVGGDRTNEHGTQGHDISGPTTDDAMTRSEEHLMVGTSTEESGRVRLRKYVTTEQETHTVPVRKERAVLEREPVTEANVGAATEGPTISEEEHEVVLNEERVVVQKEATPVERVRLGTESVTEEETVTGEVRKEHIEAEGDVEDRRA
jgi:uncharacterized protein (TIGR02271 family)